MNKSESLDAAISNPRLDLLNHPNSPSHSEHAQRAVHGVPSLAALQDQLETELATVKVAVDYVKLLALLGVERAASGHPGLPLGCASLGVLLYRYILTFTGAEPAWTARDKFVLSAGHGSMLLYALNYLFGYAIKITDLSGFRSLHAKTPGHPEVNVLHGIETTTGPLGQGFSNAVGMALESKLFAARVRHATAEQESLDPKLTQAGRIFTLMGDGCMMEGITQEAASLAGHLGLDNLIALYDDNDASIDGHVTLAMSDDTAARFRALGWHVAVVETRDTANLPGVLTALRSLLADIKKPKLLIVKTKIGAGMKAWEGNFGIHGRPAGLAAIAEFLHTSPLFKLLCEDNGGTEKPRTSKGGSKKESGAGTSGSSLEQATAYVEKVLASGEFPAREGVVPQDFYANTRGKQCYETWQTQWKKGCSGVPTLQTLVSETYVADFPAHIKRKIREILLSYRAEKPVASRELSGQVLNLVGEVLPNIIGGSADLVASTKATIKGSAYVQKGDFTGRNVAFGVREHGMGAIGNGLALGGRFIPFTSTFLVFSDYMRAAIRLAALMNTKHLFIFSHDSFYVGEDGPTHQPVEQLSSLRLIPNLTVFRPATDREMAYAFLMFLEGTGPVAIVTSRQGFQAELFSLPAPSMAHSIANSADSSNSSDSSDSSDSKREASAKKSRAESHVESHAAEEAYTQFKQGAYILEMERDPDTLELVLLGSGSEVGILLSVKRALERKGHSIRLISTPAITLLDQAENHEKRQNWENWEKLLTIRTGSHSGKRVPCYFFEATSMRGLTAFMDRAHWTWKTFDHFGLSGPSQDLERHFKFDEPSVLRHIEETFF